MRLLTLALVFALLLTSARQASASLTPQTEEMIARYLGELDRIENAQRRTSIEQLFAMTDTLREYLFYGELLVHRDWSRKEHPPTIEDLSEEAYSDLCERLRGILLNRQEVVIAEPDSGTFLPLARRKGLKPDREFMAAYFQTRPCAWPAWVVQQTDYSGCNEYGTGTLVALYGAWQRYRSDHPENYQRVATEYLEEIRKVIVEPGNACGGPASVTRELQLFLSRFPNDPNVPKVREVLDVIREGRSNIEFQDPSR